LIVINQSRTKDGLLGVHNAPGEAIHLMLLEKYIPSTANRRQGNSFKFICNCESEYIVDDFSQFINALRLKICVPRWRIDMNDFIAQHRITSITDINFMFLIKKYIRI